MSAGMLFAAACVLMLTVVMPIFIVLHFITKWRQSREFSRDDEKMLEDLWQFSQRVDERLETLERILDDELPIQRRRYESTYMEH